MLVKNDQISLTEETNKTENLWTHGVAVLLFRKRKNDRNMISWWVALKLYVSQTALEGTHKSSRPESRSPPPLILATTETMLRHDFAGRGGRSNWFERYCAADNSEQQADDPSYLTFLPWISLEAMTKDFFAIPDFLENLPHPTFGINVPQVFSCFGYQFALCNRLRTYQDHAKSAVHYRNDVFHLTSNKNPEDA